METTCLHCGHFRTSSDWHILRQNRRR